MNFINLIDDSFDKNLWNSVAPHPLQSWQWGEARKATGIEVVRLAQYNDSKKLKHVFTLTLHKLPYTSYKIGYIPRSTFPTQELCDFLMHNLHNTIFVKFEPDSPSHQNLTPNTYHLTPSPHPLFPQWTQVIDLTKSELDLLAGMKPKTRYNIRLAQKKGVVVKEMSDDQGFEIFSKLYFETCRRQRYHGHNPEYHKVVWNHLKDGVAHILISFLGNEPLAAYELFHFHNRLYYPYGGSSDKHRNVMAPNLLMWEAIKLGKNLGAKEFDLWGSQAPEQGEDNNESWSGFTRFKEGYGTTYIEKPISMDLVLNSTLYRLYNLTYQVRKTLLKLLYCHFLSSLKNSPPKPS